MASAVLTHNIYLIASSDNPHIAGVGLDAVLAAIDVSCVALKLTDQMADDAFAARAIVQSIQACNIAVLVNGSVETAREVGADGVHLNNTEELLADYQSARSVLGDQAIVGVEIIASRHDAMVLAEQGADYIAFTEEAPVDGASDHKAMLELISWWSELFEIPCVAFGPSDPALIQECLRRGADFIAIDLDKISEDGSAKKTLVEICSAIDEATVVA